MIDLESERTHHRTASEDPPPPPRSATPEESVPPEASSAPVSPETFGVMTFSVLLPLIAITISAILNIESIWHLTLRHPVETLLQCAFVLSIPIINCLTWRALVRHDGRHPIRAAILSGFSAGLTGIICAVSWTALVLGYPTQDVNGFAHPLAFLCLGGVSFFGTFTSIYICAKLRESKGTRKARSLSLVFSLLGVALSAFGLAATEAQSACMRHGEMLAVSDNSNQRQDGLSLLRKLDNEMALRLECADPRTAGLSGLFFHIGNDRLKQLYFAVTGKNYQDDKTENLAVMTDDYLKRHVVGVPIEGLSMARSALNGEIHADSLSSRLDWAFVLKNSTFSAQEARAEFALPPGAAMSGLTLWIDGKPQAAAFGRTAKTKAAYNWVTVSNRDPALLTDLGHDRVLLRCSPVPPQGEMKVRVTISVPLKMDSPTEASLTLPRLMDENFETTASSKILIRSADELKLSMKGLKSITTRTGQHELTGHVDPSALNGSALSVHVNRKADFNPLVIQKPNKKGLVLVENFEKSYATKPAALVVVLDGSKAMKNYLSDVKEALKSIPAGIATTLIVARDGVEPESMPLTQALEKLKDADFYGGEDNLPAMISAADEAGQEKDSAVLWIHGPQPSLNKEMYILSPYSFTPSFFELALDNGSTNANEFFKNHQEIGPFTAVERNSSVKDDLRSFLDKWRPGTFQYAIKYEQTQSPPPNSRVVDTEQAKEVSALYAKSIVDRFLSQGKLEPAVSTATSAHLVTPVTAAVVLERHSDYQQFGLNDPNHPTVLNTNAQSLEDQTASSEDPQLQGATNGSIGPIGDDATVISGINTSGTVRVNNLANLEATLNIVANGSELTLVLLGLFHLLFGSFGKSATTPFKLSPRLRIGFGVLLIAVGLAIPGMINWFIASARDANVFS